MGHKNIKYGWECPSGNKHTMKFQTRAARAAFPETQHAHIVRGPSAWLVRHRASQFLESEAAERAVHTLVRRVAGTDWLGRRAGLACQGCDRSRPGK